MPKQNKEASQWWKESVVYQIYPRSFQDSNGDGIGDLRGIINRLDYIASLNIDAIWLNPIYQSPNDDNGYDISDYEKILPEFGTMDDFDDLLSGLHKRGIKLIMDLVVNHTSDEHRWFKEARKCRENPYRGYYHWWPAEKGIPPKRWSYFDKNGTAWKYDEKTDAYYLHYFSEKQPDLNWENPKVRQEIYSMMRFWLDKGIDGFRMDVITLISKHLGYPEFPPEYVGSDMIELYSAGPNLHHYLREMNTEVLSQYDVMSVAEGPGTTPDNVMDIIDEARYELNLCYHFDHQNIGINSRFIINEDFQNLVKFKEVFTQWDAALAEKGWPSIYLGNHDFARIVSRWASDEDEFRRQASKMLTTFLLTMRGTPFYYMGDELGMTNIKFDKIEQYDDIMTKNWYESTQSEGGDLDAFIESHKLTARDNARTPFQWSAEEHAGFTDATPWLPVNKNYPYVNAVTEEQEQDSELHYFRQMMKVRKSHKAILHGSYKVLVPEHEHVYAYTRTLEEEEILAVLNFKSHTTTVELDTKFSEFKPLINNLRWLERKGSRFSLEPFQAIVLRCPTDG